MFWDYDWNGTGQFTDAGHTSPVTTHTYTTAGTYSPVLRVRSAGGASATYTHPSFVVTPGGGGCSYSISPMSGSFTAAGGSGSFSVTAGSGCAWSAASQVSWITTTSSGSGKGTVNYSVAANTTTSSRSGTITVGGQVYTVTENGAAVTLTAHFQSSCTAGPCVFQVGTPITFTDSSTGPIMFWDYDWNGTGVFSDAGHTSPVTSHTYTVAGTYSPVLRVRSSSGASAAYTHPAFTVTSGSNPVYIGFIDHASCDTIIGWAADRNRLNTPITVEIYDGTTLVAIVNANLSRPDVGSFLGDNGLHGFNIITPASLKTGLAHAIHLRFETAATELTGSPANITCAAAPTSYVGFVDHLGCDFIGGWAADRNRLNKPITISIYDGATLLITLPASGSRPDVGAFLGDNGLHGFTFTVPASLKNGAAHSVHVKFEFGAVELTSSPGSLTCH